MKTRRATQEDRIMLWLTKYGSITSLQAFREFGATRLSAIVYNLRKKGYDIETKYINSRNRFGDAVTYGRYILRRPSLNNNP